MKTVIIDAPFVGYPNGKKVAFAAGEEPTLSDAYAALIVGKGLARFKPADAPPVAPIPADPAPADAETPAQEQHDEAE